MNLTFNYSEGYSSMKYESIEQVIALGGAILSTTIAIYLQYSPNKGNY